jgi:DNA processing protein
MPVDGELPGWLRLSLTPGLSGQALRKLLTVFGLPSRVFAAGRAEVASYVGEPVASAINGDDAHAAVKRALQWLDEPGHTIVTLADARYPRRLLELSDAPALLYVTGDPAFLTRDILAIVGSRNATAQGLINAETFARTFSNAGLTIASGLAVGIDAAAHRGALEATGSTIAVLGCGIDLIYPARNAALYAAIAERGALVSEFALGTPPIAFNFPRRNRLISGLARGVLVVEAAISSGSLITARLAAEQGRDVFAVPGSIHSPLSKGCHALIKEGAKLVESTTDLFDEFRMPAPPRNSSESLHRTHILLDHLGHDPCDVNTLCERSGLTAANVSAMLLELELDGAVATLPGGRYLRVT